MAFAASYTVQKKRSLIKSASFISSALRTGCSSITARIGLSREKLLCSVTARTIPSLFLLPFENGTNTRIPAQTLSSSSSGMR